MELVMYAVLLAILLFIVAGLRELGARKQARKQAHTGLERLQQLLEIIKLVQQHRGLHTGYLSGQRGVLDKLQSLQSNIDHRFQHIIRLNESERSRNQVQIEPYFLRWKSIYTAQYSDGSQSFQKHSALIARLLDTLWDIADTYSLTSNHDAEIRLLADQFATVSPSIAESLGQVRAMGVKVATSKALSSDQKLQLAYTITKIENSIGQLDHEFAQTHGSEVRQFLSFIKTGIETKSLCEESAEEIFARATTLIDHIFRYTTNGYETIRSRI